MYDPRPMRGAESVGNLDGIMQYFAQVETFAADELSVECSELFCSVPIP